MIYVECYPDRALVKVMVFESVHFRGKGRALSSALRSEGCICLVDLDYEGSLSYIKGYVRKERRMPDLGMTILCLNRGIVIALENRLEDFIIASAKEVGIPLNEYNFSNDSDLLHLEISRRRIDEKFYRLLENLAESRRFKTLKEILERAKDGECPI